MRPCPRPSSAPSRCALRHDDTPEMVDNFHVIFDAAYRIGYAWATVHARTVEQKYVGPSRWTFLKDLPTPTRTNSSLAPATCGTRRTSST